MRYRYCVWHTYLTSLCTPGWRWKCVSICVLVLWTRFDDYPTKEVCQLHVSKFSFYRMSSSTSSRSDCAVLFVHKTDRIPCVTSLQCKRSQSCFESFITRSRLRNYLVTLFLLYSLCENYTRSLTPLFILLQESFKESFTFILHLHDHFLNILVIIFAIFI